MTGVYVDSYSYKWCENVSPYRCSNTATVTLLVNVDASQIMDRVVAYDPHGRRPA
jgi:hypothetical protein